MKLFPLLAILTGLSALATVLRISDGIMQRPSIFDTMSLSSNNYDEQELDYSKDMLDSNTNTRFEDAQHYIEDIVKLSQGHDKDDQCLLRINDCDLSCLDWTIVLSIGRSGSTTIQQMISKLPDMNFYGEEGGMLESFHNVQKDIEVSKERGDTAPLSWWGSNDTDPSTIACLTQKWYAERHGDKCLNRGCRHGWKEIRYTSSERVDWLRKVFPSSKIVLNYRGSCSNYTDVFGLDCDARRKEEDELLHATKHLDNVFHMKLEQLNDLSRWKSLAQFIGYDDCQALKVAVANANRSVSLRPVDYNPWKCS